MVRSDDRIPSAPRLRAASFFGARAGSNAVEFALVLPVLCFLMLGVLQGGMVLGVAHALEQISANGGRYAVAGLDAEERRAMAESWVRSEAGNYAILRPDRLKASAVETEGALTVRLFYDATYMPQIAFLGSVIGLPGTIERSSTLLLP